MSIPVIVAVLVALVAAPPASAPTQREAQALQHADELSIAFQVATRTISPSVVNIVSTQRRISSWGLYCRRKCNLWM